AVLTARAEHPFERGNLSAVVAQHAFLLGELLESLDVLAADSHQHPGRAVRLAIHVVHRSRAKIWAGETAKVRRIRGSRPRSSEDVRIRDAQPQRRPAA